MVNKDAALHGLQPQRITVPRTGTELVPKQVTMTYLFEGFFGHSLQTSSMDLAIYMKALSPHL